MDRMYPSARHPSPLQLAGMGVRRMSPGGRYVSPHMRHPSPHTRHASPQFAAGAGAYGFGAAGRSPREQARMADAQLMADAQSRARQMHRAVQQAVQPPGTRPFSAHKPGAHYGGQAGQRFPSPPQGRPGAFAMQYFEAAQQQQVPRWGTPSEDATMRNMPRNPVAAMDGKSHPRGESWRDLSPHFGGIYGRHVSPRLTDTSPHLPHHAHPAGMAEARHQQTHSRHAQSHIRSASAPHRAPRAPSPMEGTLYPIEFRGQHAPPNGYHRAPRGSAVDVPPFAMSARDVSRGRAPSGHSGRPPRSTESHSHMMRSNSPNRSNQPRAQAPNDAMAALRTALGNPAEYEPDHSLVTQYGIDRRQVMQRTSTSVERPRPAPWQNAGGFKGSLPPPEYVNRKTAAAFEAAHPDGQSMQHANGRSEDFRQPPYNFASDGRSQDGRSSAPQTPRKNGPVCTPACTPAIATHGLLPSRPSAPRAPATKIHGGNAEPPEGVATTKEEMQTDYEPITKEERQAARLRSMMMRASDGTRKVSAAPPLAVLSLPAVSDPFAPSSLASGQHCGSGLGSPTPAPLELESDLTPKTRAIVPRAVSPGFPSLFPRESIALKSNTARQLMSMQESDVGEATNHFPTKGVSRVGGEPAIAGLHPNLNETQNGSERDAEGEIDDGPLGIVFAHTSTPAATEKSWDNGFHMHKITEVMPGSAADRCGLRANDTLIRVHDQLVDSMSEHDLRIHFGAVKGTRSMNIEVLRMQPSGPHTTTSELLHLVLTRVVERASKAKLGSQSGEQGAGLTSDPLGLSMTATETLGQMQSTRASTKISPRKAHPTTNANGQSSSSPHAVAAIARSGGSDHVNGFPAVSPAQEDLPGLFGLEATPATKNNRVGHTLLTPGQQIDEEGTSASGVESWAVESLRMNLQMETIRAREEALLKTSTTAVVGTESTNSERTTIANDPGRDLVDPIIQEFRDGVRSSHCGSPDEARSSSTSISPVQTAINRLQVSVDEADGLTGPERENSLGGTSNPDSSGSGDMRSKSTSPDGASKAIELSRNLSPIDLAREEFMRQSSPPAIQLQEGLKAFQGIQAQVLQALNESFANDLPGASGLKSSTSYQFGQPIPYKSPPKSEEECPGPARPVEVSGAQVPFPTEDTSCESPQKALKMSATLNELHTVPDSPRSPRQTLEPPTTTNAGLFQRALDNKIQPREPSQTPEQSMNASHGNLQAEWQSPAITPTRPSPGQSTLSFCSPLKPSAKPPAAAKGSPRTALQVQPTNLSPHHAAAKRAAPKAREFKAMSMSPQASDPPDVTSGWGVVQSKSVLYSTRELML